MKTESQNMILNKYDKIGSRKTQSNKSCRDVPCPISVFLKEINLFIGRLHFKLK